MEQDDAWKNVGIHGCKGAMKPIIMWVLWYYGDYTIVVFADTNRLNWRRGNHEDHVAATCEPWLVSKISQHGL